MGQCSFILRYFVNEGINASKLVGCMEEIGNQVGYRQSVSLLTEYISPNIL